MEQLIFVGIILFFSILEAISRRGRDRGGAGTSSRDDWPPPSELPQVPEPRRAESPPPMSDRLPTYDEEPSFDDRIEAESGRPGGRRAREGSEGMVPDDVWEEILALARGGGPRRAPRPGQPRVPPAPPRAPVPAPRRPAPPARRPVRAPLPKTPPSVPEPVHPVHLTHPKMGTPMKGRLTHLDEAAAPPVRRDVRAALRIVSGGPASLRKAVLLSEILGPPAALRGDPYDGD